MRRFLGGGTDFLSLTSRASRPIAGLEANGRCGECLGDRTLDEVIESELCSDRNYRYDGAGDEESAHDGLLCINDSGGRSAGR